MKLKMTFMFLLLVALVTNVKAQEIQTVFKGKPSGYGALSNKFTHINGEYANLAEIYGGIYLNHRFLIGISGAALTNNIPVPDQYSVNPLEKLSYEYGQVGLVTEYALWSNRAIHVVFHLFSGAGFTVQYDRYKWDDNEDWIDNNNDNDENWFYVAEPGVQLELNFLKWMRFSPGITYRSVYGSDARGLNDAALSDWSYNVTLKFGKF